MYGYHCGTGGVVLGGTWRGTGRYWGVVLGGTGRYLGGGYREVLGRGSTGD